MKKIGQNIILLGLVSVLLGCGKTNPLKDHKSLDDSVKVHNKKQPTQTYPADEIIKIDTDKEIQFVEGVHSEYKITVRAFVDGVILDVPYNRIKYKPEWMSFKQSKDDPGVFLLKGKPPIGYTEATSRGPQRKSFEFVIDFVSAKDGRVGNMMKLITPKVNRVNYWLRRNEAAPSIASIKGLPKQVTQGSVNDFTVDVYALAANKNVKPRLDLYFKGHSSSRTHIELNGTTYIRQTGAKYIEDLGVWRFFFRIDLRSAHLPPVRRVSGTIDALATVAPAKLTFKAFTISGVGSPEKTYRIEIQLNPKEPVVVLPANKVSIASGVSFKILAINSTGHGAISLSSDTLKQINSVIGGSAKTTCKMIERGIVMSCKIRVGTLANRKKISSFIKIEFENRLGDQVSRSSKRLKVEIKGSRK